MSNVHYKELTSFYTSHQFYTKGKLCVALVVTQQAKILGLPLNPENLYTEGGGQVLGLGRGAVQTVLARHNITRILAKEGGRTSRGSIGAMREYVSFLNQLNSKIPIDLDEVELFWIEKVNVFFTAKPLKLRLDSTQSLRSLIRDLICQAEIKQKSSQGVYYVGAVMQHLIGAKLDCVLGIGQFKHNSFSTSDDQTGRNGDFVVGDVVIHVTTTPTELLIARCRENLENSLRPVIVTNKKGVLVAEGLAENISLEKRVDIFEIEQFIALNIYELSKFSVNGHRDAVNDIIIRYNEIVEEFETDPSLLIEFQ